MFSFEKAKRSYKLNQFVFQFRGTYQFQYPVEELIRDLPNLEEYEVKITATVGERFLDEIIEGYSFARFFNSSVKVFFLGSSPQVFKPTTPFTAYVGFWTVISENK